MTSNIKFDMHCHTREGSLDGKVSIKEYITILKSQGFSGMLVTDHDSYNGFRYYRDCLKEHLENFVVLKGVEYDTIDAGHILVILPENVKLPLMECRGLPVRLLSDIVHRFGGILGPAHPYGGRHLSIARTRVFRKNPDIMKRFDFVEGFNCCETAEANMGAKNLAAEYNLPVLGGSDSHRAECVGNAYTVFGEKISTETELINYVKEKKATNCGGTYYNKRTVKGKLGIFGYLLVESFWFYNRLASLYRRHKRRAALMSLAVLK